MYAKILLKSFLVLTDTSAMKNSARENFSLFESSACFLKFPILNVQTRALVNQGLSTWVSTGTFIASGYRLRMNKNVFQKTYFRNVLKDGFIDPQTSALNACQLKILFIL